MLTDRQIEILRHSLGIQQIGAKKWTKPYRNYFCGGPSPVMDALCEMGMMEVSHTINGGQDTIYIVTTAGKVACGADLLGGA